MALTLRSTEPVAGGLVADVKGPQRKTLPKRNSGSGPSSPATSRPRPVQRASRICLPHHNIRNPRPRRQRFHLPGHFLIKIFRQVLRRRIHRPKRLQIIHKLVIQPADNFPHHPLQFREVAQQPKRIQPRPFHRNAHPVIVPVHVLALPAISAQRMPRRKCLLHANLKHILFLLCDLGALLSVSSVLSLSLLSPLQESSHIPQLLRRRVPRQRLQKNLTIGHPLNPAVQKRQHSAICLAPDQPPKPLLQRQHRLRHLKLRKRISALCPQRPPPRCHDRLARHRKRQPVHNHARELLPRHIHALPEARGREQHRSRRVLESLQQRRSRRRSLQQQRKRHAPAHALEQIVHLRVARKQAERSTLAQLQQLHDFIRGRFGKSRAAHVRHVPGHVEQRLIPPVEPRRQRSLFRVVQAQPLPDVFESPRHGKRRRRQNNRVELLKQARPQNLAHVNGRRRQEHALAAPLVPIHKVPLIRFKQKRQFLPYLKTSPRDPQKLFRLLRQRCKFRLQPLQRHRQRVVAFAMLLQKRLALLSFEWIAPIPRRKRLEKCPAALANPLRPPQQRRRPQSQQPQSLVRVSRQLLKPVIRNLPPKIIAGHVLHLVCFVKHHRRIFRQDASEIVLLQRQVRKKQVMVHDDQIRFLRPLLHRGDEAFPELRALLPRAGVPARVHPRPQLRIVRQKRKLRAIPGLRQLRPILDLPELLHFLHAFEHRLVRHLVQLRAAQKIRPPLHHRDLQLRREVLLQKRNVFLVQLFLQRLRCCRNHHPPPAANRRQQIRQRLSRSGSRFHHHMVMLFERVVHQLRHLQLCPPVLVSADHAPFQQPPRAKHLGHGRLRSAFGSDALRCLRFFFERDVLAFRQARGPAALLPV